jgi:hypothetical protein
MSLLGNTGKDLGASAIRRQATKPRLLFVALERAMAGTSCPLTDARRLAAKAWFGSDACCVQMARRAGGSKMEG